MSSTLDMSLDDIAKANRASRPTRGGTSKRGGRGGASRGAANGSSGSGSGSSHGPVRNRQRFSGQARQQQQPYARPIQLAAAPIPLQYAPVPAARYTRGTGAPAGGQWKHDLYEPETVHTQQQQQPVKKIQGDTVHVSNLAEDVTDDDVREIFERIGQVKSCGVNYNSQGRSTGTATVTFVKKSDAEKAVDEYDEAEVDGRMMRLKLVGTVVTAPVVVPKKKPVVQQQQQRQHVQQAASQSAARQPIPLASSIPIQTLYAQPLVYRPTNQPRAKPAQQKQTKPAAPARGGASGGRGSRGGRGGASARATGGRGGSGASGSKKPLTQEELDNEMESYHETSKAAAAPSPAAAGQPVL